jgi:hypothetical protein
MSTISFEIIGLILSEYLLDREHWNSLKNRPHIALSIAEQIYKNNEKYLMCNKVW